MQTEKTSKILDAGFDAQADPNAVQQSQQSDLENEINLIDLAIVVVRKKMLIAKCGIGAALLGAVISLLLPNVYTATTRILPPQQSQSASAAVLGQLGAIAGIAGKDLSVKNSNDLYVGMLRSRTLLDSVIDRLQLMSYYKATTRNDARVLLLKASTVSYGKDGIIAIDVDDRNPEMSAKIANAFVEELYHLNQTLAVTEASQRRLFFESQMTIAKAALTKAENKLKGVQESTGLFVPETQAKAMVESLAVIRGQIAAKEVELSSMRSFAAEQNPDLRRSEGELVALRVQLSKVLRNNKAGPDDMQVSTQKTPEAALEYLRSLRDVKYYETAVELLAKQYELARIDEAKDSSLVQVLDLAVTPERRSKPPRLLIVLIASVLGVVIGITYAFIVDLLDRIQSNPADHARLNLLRTYAWSRGDLQP